MYVRMSTDHQKYSTENQADAIREYATRHQIEIIETYTDSGKSGLSLDGRDSLKRLIDDVQTSVAQFNMILVLDVTRWGRFQDADESAYYEYNLRPIGYVQLSSAFVWTERIVFKTHQAQHRTC